MYRAGADFTSNLQMRRAIPQTVYGQVDVA